MSRSRPDAGVERVIAQLGVGPEALLGFGGEAWVFADRDHQVLRVHHAGTLRAGVDRRAELLRGLARSAGEVPFAIPEVLDTLLVEERIVTRERRLPGRSVLEVLGETTGAAREDLVRRYLDAAHAIGDLAIPRDAGRESYGDLLRESPVEAATFRAYLERRAARSLREAGPDFAGVSAAALAVAWPEPATPSFVHLDAFPGNMLTEGGRITAVIDFGGVSLAGDRLLDPLGAAAYLAVEITPTAIRTDRQVAQEWLAERDLSELFQAAERWLAAHWSAATDDLSLHRWCRRILLSDPGDPPTA